MVYESIEPEYSEAKSKSDQAEQLRSTDKSQAINLWKDASNLLRNCNSPQAIQLAKEVKEKLKKYGG